VPELQNKDILLTSGKKVEVLFGLVPFLSLVSVKLQ